ncbi:glycoside hydrolase family protein [Rhodobium gokarnense]|uniref:Lysozyme n=1 Tax=Rhodobium gokarnense TaxID=364296 RepID=A0ABT3HHM1_9HYPH|nr:peptidoglycan-binding protein [Rhodobium gokarnense]MCW2309751.1 GH24 family phage-related lysozyme (muramidase) [Rhodobium gokarnense]
MSLSLSPGGADFIARREGKVYHAYRDAVGVVTIYTGFTWGSAVFRDYWMKTRGHKLRMGDTITEEEGQHLLMVVADTEYGAAVNASIRPTEQHHYDGATSVAFNLGKGSVTWRWATALRDGHVARCAALLRAGYNTAGGRRLQGLVNRRRLEAALIEHGDYADAGGVAVTAARFGARDDAAANDNDAADREKKLIDYQRLLKAQGFDPGPIDGKWGPSTRKAVLAFQRSHDGLVNDGILGPATMAALDRTEVAKGTTNAAGLMSLAAAGAGGAVSAFSDFDVTAFIVPAVAVAIAGAVVWAVWKNADEIGRWWRASHA